MEANGITNAIRVLFPNGIPDGELDNNQPSPGDDYDGFCKWFTGESRPTEAEIIEASEEWNRRVLKIQEKKDNREKIRQTWDELPAWITGPYRMQFDAANSLLDEGKNDQAVEMIRYEEPRSAFTEEQRQVFEAVKAQMISLIESL